MRRKIILTTVLLVIAALSVYLVRSGTNVGLSTAKPAVFGTHSPAFDLKEIYKGVCWTGEPRALSDSAIDTAKTHGIQWISQTPFGWMRAQNSPEVHYNPQRGWWGETDVGVRVTTKEAHEKGIKVMLKPHLWITRPIDDGWRSSIGFKTKAQWEQWEAGYTKFIMHFARLAKELNIEILCIGAEFTNAVLSRPLYWKNLIRQIRKVYPGKLTYAANWYKEFEDTDIWRYLDYISVQCYFPLTKKEKPTITEILNGWKPHLKTIEAVSAKYNKPVLLAEIGYTNKKGATIKPWEWSNRAPAHLLDQSEQANAYEALFRAFGDKKWLAGIFIWKWYPSHNRVSSDRINFSPQNKPAADVLKKWYTFK